MEEKVLIKSENYKLGNFYIAFLLIGIVITTIMIIDSINTCASIYEWHLEDYKYHMNRGYCDIENILGVEVKTRCSDCARIMDCGTKEAYIFDYFLEDAAIFTLIPIGISLLIVLIVFFYMHGYEITVSDKRVYGKTIFGKTVDLPIDSVSSTTANKFFKGISIATSSGKISFRGIKNWDKIRDVINTILMERQQKTSTPNATTIIENDDDANQIKKFKDLLDSGAITQEEFDAKKKQILGL